MGKKKSFEDKLKDLESVVKEMEQGDLSLEESIASFEKGVKLYQDCKVSLDSAEKKIKVLTETLQEEDF